MTESVRIRPARHPELPALSRLIRNRLPDLMGSGRRLGGSEVESHLATLLPDGALILAIRERRLAGLAALDLDASRLLALYLDPERAQADTARDLIQAIEAQAGKFGVQNLVCTAKPQARAFLERLGYQANDTSNPDGGDDSRPVNMSKSLLDSAGEYQRKVLEILDELGIPRDYGIKHRLTIIEPPDDLVSVGADVFGRDQQLRPQASSAWTEMRMAARHQNVELQLVSGFRSLKYQAGLLRKKLDSGASIDEVLATSAAPGFSEHHSGSAVDINAPGVPALTSQFARSKAYEWLRSNAGLYGFHESYAKNNRHGLEWEPWHWYFRRRPGAAED